jgi:hypothetical protein
MRRSRWPSTTRPGPDCSSAKRGASARRWKTQTADRAHRLHRRAGTRRQAADRHRPRRREIERATCLGWRRLATYCGSGNRIGTSIACSTAPTPTSTCTSSLPAARRSSGWCVSAITHRRPGSPSVRADETRARAANVEVHPALHRRQDDGRRGDPVPSRRRPTQGPYVVATYRTSGEWDLTGQLSNPMRHLRGVLRLASAPRRRPPVCHQLGC